MNKRLVAAGLVALALTLTGCSNMPSADTRLTSTAAYLHDAAARDSQGLADAMDKAGVYAGIADDLVKMCDEGNHNPSAYASAFDDRQAADIAAAWTIACPTQR